eukprot:jgi/Botrbrau1/10007/Bobra.0012s0095.1
MNTRHSSSMNCVTPNSGARRRCVLEDLDHCLRLWPFDKKVEKAFLADTSSGSRLSDRLWAFVGAFTVLTCKPGNDIILNCLMLFCLAFSVTMLALSLSPAHHRTWRSRLLFILRVPYGLCVSALFASAFKRRPTCITTFAQFLMQVFVLRSRFISPFCFTGAFHSGVLSHFIYQSLHTALLLVTLNRQDCANMASFPVLQHMNSRMADFLDRVSHSLGMVTTHVLSLAASSVKCLASTFPSSRVPGLQRLLASAFESTSFVPLANNASFPYNEVFTRHAPQQWSPEDACVTMRGAVQVGVLLSTTVLLYISELHGRMKHATNLGRPEGFKAFLSRNWLLHVVAGVAILAICGAVAVVTQPLFSARTAASLLYDWSEVAGDACPS